MLKSQMKTQTQKRFPVADREGYPSGSSLSFTMQKYYKDIGSRLSEMPAPEQHADSASDDLTRDFCMLTIDTRHIRSLKQRTHSDDGISVSRDESRSNDDESTETYNSVSGQPAFRKISNVSSPRDHIDCSYRKQRLLEKLTCSLFLKKHMCARCQRKSRSCVSNKTFSGSQKRYLCLKCREASRKTIFNEDYNFSDSELSHSTSGQIFDSQSKENIIPMLRKNIKDSGYDTVTSCSTLASAYSAFSTPANSKYNISKDKPSTKPVLYGDQTPSSVRNISAKSNDKKPKCKSTTAHKSCLHSNPNIISNTAQDSDSELSDIISTSQPESTEEEFRHAKQRNVPRYDGYLTQIDYNEQDQNKPRPIHSDTSNVDEVSGNGDTCYFPPRIIRVSQTGKETTTATKKSCYTCESTTKPCFRLPWEGGWICEDCLDGLH
ncbi:unnamed protein product [Candidula unifasciata]|uniref:Uncharacterized protein n=1 Tax=Candidula unifasciata TaxID=100452 RepID=A0A8S4A2H2_9EUPU|nr:unnamed protein product [Candidula unifasciata]